jgi:formyltetrahydrofolate-dependent phosphoribosylglycinamide formyltransferase
MLPRLVVLISGSGTNLQAILDAIAERRLQAEVVLVISNRKAALGLVRAGRAGVPHLYFPLKPYRDASLSREAYDADLAEVVSNCRPDLIVLAGWMHVLSPAFLDRFPHQVINLHPALPDTFPGTEAIRRAFEAYRRGEITHSGCMVHYAVPEVDAGAVIVSAAVPIQPDDTLDSFEERMHATEHGIIVEAIQSHLQARFAQQSD